MMCTAVMMREQLYHAVRKLRPSALFANSRELIEIGLVEYQKPENAGIVNGHVEGTSVTCLAVRIAPCVYARRDERLNAGTPPALRVPVPVPAAPGPLDAIRDGRSLPDQLVEQLPICWGPESLSYPGEHECGHRGGAR